MQTFTFTYQGYIYGETITKESKKTIKAQGITRDKARKAAIDHLCSKYGHFEIFD